MLPPPAVRRFGCPYQGSKSQIAWQLINALPAADTFVDLFAGGCAMTHAALLSGKYKHFLANDLGGIPQVFLDAIHGAAHDRSRWLRWVTREEFVAERNKPFAERDLGKMIIWSFGNNGNDYLYGTYLEPWKRALWAARVDGDYSLLAEFGIITTDASRKAVLRNREEWTGKYIAWYKAHGGGNEKGIQRLQSLQSLERLQSLESLQSLQSLQRLQDLQSLQSLQSLGHLRISKLDYRRVPIPANSCVYADPPYESTEDYCGYSKQENQKEGEKIGFDNPAFWQWVRTRDFPVFVSEYTAPEDFVPILQIEKRQLMRGGLDASHKVTENLFVHNRFAAQFKPQTITQGTLFDL